MNDATRPIAIASSEIEMTRGVVVKSPRWSSLVDEACAILSVYQPRAPRAGECRKRGGTNCENGYNAPSAVRRSKPARHHRAQVGFGGRRVHVEAAFDQTVDQRADDLGAIERSAGLAAAVRSEPIEVSDLPIEEDDGDLRPGLVVDGRAARSGFALGPRRMSSCAQRFGPSLRHRTIVDESIQGRCW